MLVDIVRALATQGQLLALGRRAEPEDERWRWATTGSMGRGAVSEGSTNVGPWLSSEMASSFSLCQPDAVNAGLGLELLEALQPHIDSFCAHSIAGRGSGGGGISDQCVWKRGNTLVVMYSMQQWETLPTLDSLR